MRGLAVAAGSKFALLRMRAMSELHLVLAETWMAGMRPMA